jgi:hypothetical protein
MLRTYEITHYRQAVDLTRVDERMEPDFLSLGRMP